jgi:hypothetical protein
LWTWRHLFMVCFGSPFSLFRVLSSLTS